MQIRYLVSIYEVNCAVPLRDHLANLIATTAYIPDRNIYAANVTLAQWNKIREEYWATGRQCDHGRLVPSIDFVASDGKSFLDFEECRKHEASIAKVQEPAPPFSDAIQALIELSALARESVELSDWPELQMALEKAATIIKTQVGEAVNSPDSYSGIVGSSPTPATTSFKEALAGHKTPEEMSQSEAFAGQMPDVPQTLEDRMLVVVGSNYMNISLVASLLKAKEDAVRAVAESSDKFRVSGTGRSICKTDTL